MVVYHIDQACLQFGEAMHTTPDDFLSIMCLIFGQVPHLVEQLTHFT